MIKYCSLNASFGGKVTSESRIRLALAKAVASAFVQLVFGVSNTAFVCGWLLQL